MVRYVTDAQGRLVEENIPQGQEAIDPRVAVGLTHMLQGVVERGTAVAAKVLERPLAGKTGTTNDFSNAWFVGYTPSIVAGVWVGHDRPRSLGPEETGARAALPIWVGGDAGRAPRAPGRGVPPRAGGNARRAGRAALTGAASTPRGSRRASGPGTAAPGAERPPGSGGSRRAPPPPPPRSPG